MMTLKCSNTPRATGMSVVALLGMLWTCGCVSDASESRASEPDTVSTSQAVTAVEGTRRLAVLLLNWQENPIQPATVDRVRQQMFTDTTSVNAYYQATSYGRMNLTGDVFGWYTVASPMSPCDTAAWSSDALAQAQAQGLDVSSYDHFMFVWPSTSCPWSGYAEQPGSHSYINGITSYGVDTRSVAHELGHNFGVGHANTLVCYDTNGVQVQVSSNCVSQEYQDGYEVMGNSSMFTMNATHRTMLGWLPTSNTTAVTASGTYTIAPLEHTTNSPQALQIIIPYDRKKGAYPNYCIEFRQSYGWDDFQESSPYGIPWAVNGILIRRQWDCLNSSATYLMDATPNSPNEPSGATYWDQTLYPDKTFTDLAAQISITTLSVSSAGATVKVDYLTAPKGRK